MNKPLVIPKIILIGMIVWVFGAILAAAAYYYETTLLNSLNSSSSSSTPLFDLFADAFKVGLGAFIGVVSQWANRVFSEAGTFHSQQSTFEDPSAESNHPSNIGE